MIRFLLTRPIATFVVAFSLTGLGLLTMRMLPVSLLPNLPVPELSIQASYPSADARQLQTLLALPLRNQLLQLNRLDDLEVTALDGQVRAKVRLDYGTDVDLAYLEANEKIDALMGQLPRDMERPQVIKAGADDIAVFQLNVWQRTGGDSSDYYQLSRLCQTLLKRRLEQLPEVALVDISGLTEGQWVVRPRTNVLTALQISPAALAEAIRSRDLPSGAVSVKEGPYEFSIRLKGEITQEDELRNTFLTIGKDPVRVMRLSELAELHWEEKPPTGLHYYNGRRAVALGIIKRSDAQVLTLADELEKVLTEFTKDHPQLAFAISQDQTELLRLSIDNLIGSLWTGALLTFVMVFFFMHDKRVLFIIGLLIPVALSVTMLAFYLLGMSINIVSLAGLVLGIGEIIDSAIIIIENIEQKREAGLPLRQACDEGAEEVIRPLATSVATNSAVFLPLLFLSGLAGALFMDQAISVTLALGVSLLASYTLVPVLYSRLFAKQQTFAPIPTLAQRGAVRLYDSVLNTAFRFPKGMVMAWVVLLFVGASLAYRLPKQGMPNLSRNAFELTIDWNEPISLSENQRRVERLPQQWDRTGVVHQHSYIGTQQFLLNPRGQRTTTEAMLHVQLSEPQQYQDYMTTLQQQIRQQYPNANVEARPALNVFEQLFKTDEAPLRIHLSRTAGEQLPTMDEVQAVAARLEALGYSTPLPPQRSKILLSPQWDRMALYGVSYEQFLQTVQTSLMSKPIGTLRGGQEQVDIVLGTSRPARLDSLIRQTLITTQETGTVPLAPLVRYTTATDYALLSSGAEGAYVPLIPTSRNALSYPEQQAQLQTLLAEFPHLTARFTGSYLRDQGYLRELWGIGLLAVALLFFILAAQFESLQQPFIVLLTIVFGSTGAMLVLAATGQSLNLMTGIGFIVLIGLLDNDSILKIDTMNRSLSTHTLRGAVREGGLRRLQSQLMTYLTTVLGLAPLLWAEGLGAELQRPLALTVIGGMTLGVVISWTFIPLMYYWLAKRKVAKKGE